MAVADKRRAEKRVAFVLGNGAYVNVNDTLSLPADDAKAVAAALGRLGFAVIGGHDLTHDEVMNEFDRFERELRGCNVGLIYYSGHGLQVEGINYIVPVDADMRDEDFVKRLIPIQPLISSVAERVEATLVFLDACRQNPFVESLNNEREAAATAKGLPAPLPLTTAPGLAPVGEADALDAEAFLAFAAAPGQIASEGLGKNSIFTEELLAHIETTDLSLDYLMKRVIRHVRKITDNEQQPWGSSSMQRPFYFSRGSLIWFNANIIGFAAFLIAILVYSLVIVDRPDFPYVIVATVLLFATLWIFLVGLGRSYRFLRGDFEGTESFWRRSLLGGFFGGVFASPIVAASYYFFWDLPGWEPAFGEKVPSFGQVLSEVLVACVLAGAVLGPLSYVLSRRPPLPWFEEGSPSPYAALVGGILGGVIAGIMIGPPVTWYFGRFDRPPVSELILLPGGLLGAAVMVFSIVTYSVERISYRKMRTQVVASVLATLLVAAISAAVLFLGDRILQEAIGGVLNTRDPRVLLVTGLAVGVAIGIILGSAISLALLFVDRMESTTAGSGWRLLAGR